ncbi:MAG: preprotein translocase subunit SecA [Hyphomicrobiaceae bacterium]|jgi:preprotein translocase subunit SecA
MLQSLGTKIFGNNSTRFIKKLRPSVKAINGLEESMKAMSDAELQGSTARFRTRLDNGEELDSLIPEAFAVVREASMRVLGMRHFDVQLMGGLILHDGRIAEMKTGEGKTLVATLPIYANALPGKGAHLVTVNDYLASRDAEWMGRLYGWLGMSVGVIYSNMSEPDRVRAYGSDITYGQNNEFGFDYLRDNMKFSTEAFAQRDLNFAIVDEVDSILVDEARTPLIISGPAEESTEKYYTINRIIPRLEKEEHFTVDEKHKTAQLTEEGVTAVEEILGIENLYDPSEIEILHHVNQGLRAHAIYRCDVDYMITDEKEVVIVDEFTGRLMPGRRWSDGLHQAIEAKEGVKIERENQTLATITFQNYFRMYSKLSGMTGTAETEAEEFRKIYGLDVIAVPTNQPMVRKDFPDVVYKTEREKFVAVAEDIEACNVEGQPVLVGTISIEKSEQLSNFLKKAGVKHHVLNAKHHEHEAEIVSQAGSKGAVTLSTNMAGRGTDIVLGGNPEFLTRAEVGSEDDPRWEDTLAKYKAKCASEREEVLAAGGLHIIGTERHESRRIDNQLRGRSGRQGDPGSSRFYLSLEDDLLRIFGAERIQGLMEKLGMEEGIPIESRMVSRAVENAQRKVEGHNFDMRKHLLEYDDVMNKQREIIYGRRRELLTGEGLREEVLEIAAGLAEGIAHQHAPEDLRKPEWDWKAVDDGMFGQFRLRLALSDEERESATVDALASGLQDQARAAYEAKAADVGSDVLAQVEHVLMLQSIDHHWKDHLLAMDHLKEGIGLRGYGQRNPLQEYQREGYDMFEEMLGRYEQDVVEKLFAVRIEAESDVQRMEAEQKRAAAEQQRRLAAQGAAQARASGKGDSKGRSTGVQPERSAPRVGRNEPCPCGSGKKYKKCHGKVA